MKGYSVGLMCFKICVATSCFNHLYSFWYFSLQKTVLNISRFSEWKFFHVFLRLKFYHFRINYITTNSYGKLGHYKNSIRRALKCKQVLFILQSDLFDHCLLLNYYVEIHKYSQRCKALGQVWWEKKRQASNSWGFMISCARGNPF